MVDKIIRALAVWGTKHVHKIELHYLLQRTQLLVANKRKK